MLYLNFSNDKIFETYKISIYFWVIYAKYMKYLKENNLCYSNLPKEYKDKEIEFGKTTFGKVLLNVTLKKDAKEVIDKLKSEGNKIIIVTARNTRIYDDPVGFTTKQLEKLGIKYDKLVCSFDKKQACIDEKIDIFIDDIIDNLKQVESVTEKVLLFNSMVNKSQNTSFQRVNSWKEIYEYISNYPKGWNIST